MVAAATNRQRGVTPNELDADDDIPSGPSGTADGAEAAFEQFGLDFDLTKRETDLLPLAYRHYSARKIGELCYISEATVYTHLKRIYRKCGVHGREKLVECIDEWIARH